VALDSGFPDSTKEEKHYVVFLKRGYIDASYKADYNITPEELSTLVERVKKLQALADELCKETIASFDETT
jgi:hypothetical protein